MTGVLVDPASVRWRQGKPLTAPPGGPILFARSVRPSYPDADMQAGGPSERFSGGGHRFIPYRTTESR
jgi:hypothetical protein